MEVVHVWVGIFDATAPEDYFKEVYGEDHDPPLSTFAADQGETWYDHDWVEMSWLDEEDAPTVADLVHGHSYSEVYRQAVVDRAAEMGIESANVFVMADQSEFDSPRSVEKAGIRLQYLGTFEAAEPGH